MTSQNPVLDPKAHDEEMARKFHERDKARQRVKSAEGTLYRMAGARWGYRTMRASSGYWQGQRWVYNESLGRNVVEHFEITEDIREALLSEKDPSERNLTAGCSIAEAQEALAQREGEVDRINESIREHDEAYTGWSRFFLVTSSSGHIHSKLNCHTCRTTTEFGWLPQLSGKSNAEAVNECGPTLCTVCFPEAPVDWTQGKKLTKSAAAKLVA